LVRAHFETTGAVAYFLRELTKFKNNEYDNQQLYHSVRAMTLGMREISKAFPAPERVPRIPSVLTYIDEVDKFIKRNSSTKMPLFRTDYEFLSEFCHPNAFAFILSGRGDSLRKGRSGPSNTLTPKDLHTLLVFQFHTSYHFIVLYDQVWELIKERFTSS
jgi:hypothetical protein